MEVIIRSGMVVTGILFIRKWAGSKISRKLQYYIWVILPIVMLIFPYFRIPVPAFEGNERRSLTREQGEGSTAWENALEEKIQEATFFPDNQDNSLEVQKDNDLPEVNERKEENLVKAEGKLLYNKNVFGTIRIIVMGVLISFMLGANGIFAEKLLKRRIFFTVDKETKVKIYLLEECATPFLFGKNIYLNPDMTKNAEAMRYMILHEYCHLKQGDFVIRLVKNIFCVVYWFDPFIWLAAYYMNRDCELACDEAVIEIIGADKRQEYGMTLLKLLKGKGNRDFITGISMGGKKSLIRERILFLSKPLQKRSRRWTLAVLAGCVILTGCSLIGDRVSDGRKGVEEPTSVFDGHRNINESAGISEKQKNPKNEPAGAELQTNPEYLNTITRKEANEKDIPERQNNDEIFWNLENNYYNNAKVSGGKLYFTQSGYLCSMDLTSKAITQLEKGKFILGNIDGDYLYYLKYPTDSEEASGIGRMNLAVMEQQILLPWKEKYWSCTEIYSKEGCLYLGMANECEAFMTEGGRVVKSDKHDNKIANDIEFFGDLMKELPAVNYGYINSIFNFHIFTIKDSSTGILYICDTKEKQVYTKTGCMGDVLVSEYGVIYLMLNGDIYLSPLDNPDENRLMFSAGESGNGVTYGTYDKNGLYVFENIGDTVKCKCILWEGGIVDIKEFPGTRLSIDLKLSAFTDFIVYFENEKINLV